MPAAELACMLSPADMGPRLARIRQLTRAWLRSHGLQGSTLHLIYGPDAAAELAAIVALERECCGFLSFQLNEGHDAVELLIVAPLQQETDAQWLFSQFLPESPDAGCRCRKG